MTVLLKRRFIVVLLLCSGITQGAWAHALAPVERPWFAGVQAGTAFGQGTFRSITEHGIHWGLQGGIFGGYRFNRLVSLELGAQFGGQNQFALDCCPYWMSDAEVRYMAPVMNENGWYYEDLRTATRWGKLALQANVDLLSLFTSPGNRWTLNASPQISAVTTKTTLVTPDKEIQHARQWHFGLGGQASVGYQISKAIGAAIYGGITCLTGERFDNIPIHAHKSNLIWDAGVKVSFSFGGKKAQPAEAAAPEDDAAARLAAEQKAREEAKAQEEAKAREEAEQKAREEAEQKARVEAEQKAAAVAKEEAFQTPIPTVYFLNDSSIMDKESAASLEEALAILNKYPDFQLEIHAYASKVGTEEYNRQISKKRMEEVRNWFISHGVDEARIGRAYFHGVDKDAPTAEKARRAELKFVK